MLRFRDFFAVFLLMGITLVVGCESEIVGGGEPTEDGGGSATIEKNSDITFDRDVLEVDGDGGDMDIIYRVKNPVKGATLDVQSRVDWVVVKEVTNNQIIFTITKNMNREPRETIVTVNYAGLDGTKFITIRQDKVILNMFSFEITDKTYKSCTVRYIPANDNMLYMANVIDMQFFTYSGITTEDAFIETEMKNYLRIATEYQMTLEELMYNATPQLIYKGEALRGFTGMQHGGKYVVYSYGVTFSGNDYTINTPIHHTIVELPMPTMYDVTFDLRATVNTSGGVTLSIDPGSWSGHYSIQVAPDNSLYYVPEGEPLSEMVIRSLADTFFNNARTSIAQGNSVERFLNSTCYKGVKQLPLALNSGQRYMIIVFAVESEDGAIPVMRSVPSVTYVNL